MEESQKIDNEQYLGRKHYSNDKKEERNASKNSNELAKRKEKSNNSYDNFILNSKELIFKMNNKAVSFLCLLDDGRFTTASYYCNIFVYNKKTYKPDLVIKGHNSTVCIIKIKKNILVRCSAYNDITLFKVKGNDYVVLQDFYYEHSLHNITEIKNKNLLAFGSRNSIVIFLKNNDNKIQKDYEIPTNSYIKYIAQTKENEISYLESDDVNSKIYFYNLDERKIKFSLSKSHNPYYSGIFNMITKDLLMIGEYNQMSLINVNNYKLVNQIIISDSYFFSGICRLNENMFLAGDFYGKLRQWKIEGNNIKLISTKDAHKSAIQAVIKFDHGKIVSCCCSEPSDKSFKIWN